MVSGIKNKKRNLGQKNSAETLKDLIIASLEEDKAEGIVTIDLTGKASFAHYLIVATGRSSRHVISTADKLVDRLIAAGHLGIGIEGKSQGDWVLVDAHDIIVHIFRAEVRKDYEIEKMWGFTTSD
jgi:ribosome-associated protein